MTFSDIWMRERMQEITNPFLDKRQYHQHCISKEDGRFSMRPILSVYSTAFGHTSKSHSYDPSHQSKRNTCTVFYLSIRLFTANKCLDF